tara:strand:- start:874 stop:1368 length:495 start_codon:yes stop_codon:yes gene_type:complete
MTNSIHISKDINKLNVLDLNELKSLAAKHQRYRFCLHENESSAIQEMIICLKGQNYFNPHRHPEGVVESYHMIEGSMDVFYFNDLGDIIGKTRLSALNGGNTEDHFFHKISAPIYHTVFTRTDWAIYHEVVTGPWSDSTSEVASFAPQDKQNINAFMKQLNEYN